METYLKIAIDFLQIHLYLVGIWPHRSMFEVMVQRTTFSDACGGLHLRQI
ncbi:hypothetical protein JYQ62_27030 [Nostoc sp. UHCC 0702]|nr:hypothetical protein JYQ62_27030 [Nostoc sp. UHCC 0702]